MSKPTEVQRLLVTYKEAAAMLSCSTGTIYRECEQGRLNRVKVRGRPRVTLDSIEHYIQQNRDQRTYRG